jgi:hypothetical protein
MTVCIDHESIFRYTSLLFRGRNEGLHERGIGEF